MRRIMLFMLAMLAVCVPGIVGAEITPGEIVRGPAGPFEMGNRNDDGECAEYPVDEITLTTAYEIGGYELSSSRRRLATTTRVKNLGFRVAMD